MLGRILLMWWRALWRALCQRTFWWHAAIVPLAGCTPLGLWLYEDPRVALSKVSLASARSGDSIQVALALDNRNDYTVEATRVEIALLLDGVAIGHRTRDTLVALAQEEVSLVAMPLELTGRPSATQLEQLYAGTHRYQVEGRAEFRTPVGVRRVKFQEQGAMVFGSPAER